MKKTSLSTKLIIVFVALAVVAYFGMQTYSYLVNPIATTLVYPYLGEETVEMNGWFVRDEAVIDCQETLLEIKRAEGERVAVNKVLATVYQSADALASAQEADRLRSELEQLNYARNAASDAEAALRLDSDIESGLFNLRAALARGDYTALEGDAAALKTTVLRREYANRDASELSARAEELQSRIDSASASAGGAAQVIRAPFAGTYSAVVDGYESALTPDMLEDLTPAKLDETVPGAARSTVGKLIRGNVWYYAAAVDEAEAQQISEGRRLTLRVSGVDLDLPVRVEDVGHAIGGRCTVVLRGSEYLAHVTMLRQQKAELILRSYDGLRIPKIALRVDEEGNTGVYCLIGLSSYFKPVEVLYQGEDYCLVRPGEIDASTEGQVTVLTLRANDEVIVSAGELYNGKVVGKS